VFIVFYHARGYESTAMRPVHGAVVAGMMCWPRGWK